MHVMLDLVEKQEDKLKRKAKNTRSDIFNYNIKFIEDERYCQMKAAEYFNMLKTNIPHGIFKQLSYLFLKDVKRLYMDWEVKFNEIKR